MTYPLRAMDLHSVKSNKKINRMMNNLISSRNDNEVNEIVNSFKSYITDNISLVNEIDQNDEMLTTIEETYHLEKHLSLKFSNKEMQNIMDKISPFSSNKSKGPDNINPRRLNT